MALIKCHECEKEISDEAKTCPHCGAKPKTGMGIGKVLVLALFVLFVISMVMGKISSENAEEQESTRRSALTPAERATEDRIRAAAKKIPDARWACQQALIQSLHDPDSAKLERANTWYAENQKGGTVLVQPTGRAKNAFGAYIQGTWDCVTKQINGNTVVLSLKQIRP